MNTSSIRYPQHCRATQRGCLACRQGDVPPHAFVAEFRDLCGDTAKADSVLSSLALLLPTAELQVGSL